MTVRVRTKKRIEFGDFQTPPLLAREVCGVLARDGCAPHSVVEPTCGRGSLLIAAVESFPTLRRAVGIEINSEHAEFAQATLNRAPHQAECRVTTDDFFQVDWKARLAELPDPLLVLGNPPWVTNAAVGALGGANLPAKSNFQGRSGLDALTGKSNFDISEWMLIRLLEAMQGRTATLAMLCKTAVARKILLHGWKHDLISYATIRLIDAQKHFNAAVEACLLTCVTGSTPAPEASAEVFPSLAANTSDRSIALRNGSLVSDATGYDATKQFAGSSPFRWRSGIKHDCAKVMELTRVRNRFQNGYGELVELEENYVYPLLKSSQVAAGRVDRTDRWMIVTQRKVGDDTRSIADSAPKTWTYLQRHAGALDRRGSSIYRGRPRFCVFGVGDYTFTPHKVAISGLYQKLEFAQVGSDGAKPFVLDDTCTFIACRSASEAALVCELLMSQQAKSFFESRIFWDAKRPITADVLNQLDLAAVGRACSPAHPLVAEWSRRPPRQRLRGQRSLFAE
jgi:hypothetical protein